MSSYDVGPDYTIVTTELPNGQYHAAVFRGDERIGNCMADDRMALEVRAVQVAMRHFRMLIDKLQCKP